MTDNILRGCKADATSQKKRKNLSRMEALVHKLSRDPSVRDEATNSKLRAQTLTKSDLSPGKDKTHKQSKSTSNPLKLKNWRKLLP